ncbi:MAG: N-6 DNA methylase, partial [Candidatus Zixiibacteriota bacterium]
GTLVDRVHRELSPEDLEAIAGVYHNWRNLPSTSGRGAGGEGTQYKDKAGWWKSATLDDIKGHSYVLTPGRYVGAEEIEDDGVTFEEKMSELSSELYEQFAKADQLEATIKKNLKHLGYGE